MAARVSFWLTLSALVRLGCGCGKAMPNVEDIDDPVAHTQTALRDIVASNDAPGIAYSVVTADSIVFEGAAGVTDTAGGAPVTPETMFMVYSTTKALTAILVMQLVEQGLMSLDAPLSSYVSTHPFGDRVTIRMLLAHTAGVPNPVPLDWFFVEGEASDRKAALARVLESSNELADEPGAEYRYSNLGYWLLESAVEQATGRSFSEAFTSGILQPLGIEGAASFELPPRSRLAVGHSRTWTLQTPVLYLLTPSRYWASRAGGWSRFERLVPHGMAYGGLYASPTAFTAVLRDLLRGDGSLLSPASRATLFAPQHTTDGRPSGDCLGWTTGKLRGMRYIGKHGGGAGFHGNVRLYPELQIATVFFANATRVTAKPIDALSDRLDAPFVLRREGPRLRAESCARGSGR